MVNITSAGLVREKREFVGAWLDPLQRCDARDCRKAMRPLGRARSGQGGNATIMPAGQRISHGHGAVALILGNGMKSAKASILIPFRAARSLG
jgi:hypothetical protein